MERWMPERSIAPSCVMTRMIKDSVATVVMVVVVHRMEMA